MFRPPMNLILPTRHNPGTLMDVKYKTPEQTVQG